MTLVTCYRIIERYPVDDNSTIRDNNQTDTHIVVMFGATETSTAFFGAGFLATVFNFATTSAFFKYVLASVLWLIDRLFGVDYIAFYFPNYLTYLKWFLIFCFAIMPLFFILNLYVSCALYHIYCHRREVLDQVRDDVRHLQFRKACRKMTAAIWYATARIWNGYEVVYHPLAKKLLRQTTPSSSLSSSNSSSSIPVMLVYYHGALPVDLYYFVMCNVRGQL